MWVWVAGGSATGEDKGMTLEIYGMSYLAERETSGEESRVNNMAVSENESYNLENVKSWREKNNMRSQTRIISLQVGLEIS